MLTLVVSGVQAFALAVLVCVLIALVGLPIQLAWRFGVSGLLRITGNKLFRLAADLEAGRDCLQVAMREWRWRTGR